MYKREIYIAVVKDLPGYYREVRIVLEATGRVCGNTNSDPLSLELAEYPAIRATSFDMAKASNFDQDTRIAKI